MLIWPSVRSNCIYTVSIQIIFTIYYRALFTFTIIIKRNLMNLLQLTIYNCNSSSYQHFKWCSYDALNKYFWYRTYQYNRIIPKTYINYI